MPENDGAHACVAAKVLHPRTARQENTVEIPGRDRVEHGIGVDGDSIASVDVNAFSICGSGDLRARSSQQINRRDRLHLFKTLGQNGENVGHVADVESIMQRGLALAAIVHLFRHHSLFQWQR